MKEGVSAGRERGHRGKDEEKATCAEVEVVEGRFFLFAEWLVCQEDCLAVHGLAEPSDLLFLRRDEGRDQYASVFGKVFPAAELVGPQFFRIGAMDYDRCLEGIVEQLEITVCLPQGSVDLKIVDPAEKIGIESPCQQAVRILSDIVDDRREAVDRPQVAVVEIFGEDVGDSGEDCSDGLAAFHFHHADIPAEGAGQICTGKDGEVDMVGHDDILEDLERWAEVGEIEDLRLNDLAQF